MKSILLIGLGVFGSYVAKELGKMKTEVLAVDVDEERVNQLLPYVADARIGDCTERGFLETLGVGDFDVCIVAISSSFQASLEITYLLKKLGAKKIISRASRDIQAELLLHSGADEIVYPQKQSAAWTAIKYSFDSVLDYMDLNGEYAMFEIPAPKEWKGKNLIELKARQNYGMNIIGIKENGRMDMAFSADRVFTGTESVLVVGEQEKILRQLKD